jgi:hypothetical protein
MLYLKLAQLRGQLQSCRTEFNAAEDASDLHTIYRSHVMTRTGELRREVQVATEFVRQTPPQPLPHLF